MREINLEESTPKPIEPGEEVRAVLLPLQDTNLLLPNITVAEVIGYREEDPVVNAPEWLRGVVNWNRRKIPVVSFEYFIHSEAVEPGYRARIAVCHNLLHHNDMPFVGILCSSIPRLARANASSVTEPMMQEILPDMTYRHVSYNGEDAWLPNFEKLCAETHKVMFE